jgi:hypothetical protein
VQLGEVRLADIALHDLALACSPGRWWASAAPRPRPGPPRRCCRWPP